MSDITGSRTYGDGNVMNTRVSVPGAPGLPPQVLAALEERRRQQAAEADMRLRMQQAQLNAMRQNSSRSRREDSQRGNQGHEGGGQRPNSSASSSDEMEPVYGVQGLGGVLTPYIPGLTPLGPGQSPVVMGQKRKGTAQGPSSAGFGRDISESKAGLSGSPPTNQPAAGGFFAGGAAGSGGTGSGEAAQPGMAGPAGGGVVAEAPPSGQQAILIRNMLKREAQQEAMRQEEERAQQGYGYGGPRSNSGRVRMGGDYIGQ